MNSKFSRWIKRILNTQTDEINCSACLDQISSYVDLELAGGNTAEQMPRVKQHLEQCGVCFEEYQMLHDLADLERESGLPTEDELVNKLKRPPR